MRGTWVWDRDAHKLVPKAEFYRNRPQELRSDFPCPMLSRGQMEETWNPVDGKHYSTLRNYEKAIPKGQHIVEKGEWEKPQVREINQAEVEQVVADSWNQMEAGYKGE